MVAISKKNYVLGHTAFDTRAFKRNSRSHTSLIHNLSHTFTHTHSHKHTQSLSLALTQIPQKSFYEINIFMAFFKNKNRKLFLAFEDFYNIKMIFYIIHRFSTARSYL